MWFPYSLPGQWKSESPREQINEALADDSLRSFLVGFYLRNPVNREWEVELQLEQPEWQSGRTSGGEALEIGFYPSDNSRLSEVMFRLRGTQPRLVLEECYRHMSGILDQWGVAYGRGFAISGFRVADLAHDARWRALPHRPSAEDFRLPERQEKGREWLAIASLYREARNATSPDQRLACLGKIFRLWEAGSGPFQEGPQEGEDGLVISKEMLVLSGYLQYRPYYEGLGFSELLPEARQWQEWALQRLTGLEVPPPLADFAEVGQAEALANLLDMAAQQLLAGCLADSREEAEA